MSRARARAHAGGPWSPSPDDVLAVLALIRDTTGPAEATVTEAEVAWHLAHRGPT